ncbi:MAG: tyrosine-type recombinase/integrase [Eubacteriales bacterium]|nr:tyrosine-type recombinase/integrase [Eubacteriales bacterium]
MGKDLQGNELGQGIIQKKDGRYEARYVNRFGKRTSVSGRNLKEVRKKYNEAIYENDKELNLREDMKLDEWYSQWMNVYKIDVIRNNTRTRYKSIYQKHISPYLGNYKLRDIKQIDIKRLINDMEKNNYHYETKNAVRILLVDIFNKAINNEYLMKNPAKGITVKRDEEKDIRVLSVEEQTIFFDSCKGTFYDNLYVVAVSTGMRIGELAALRWSDIDLDKKVIHITRTLVYQKYDTDTKKQFHFELPKTKTSKRDIPINRQCEIALKKQFIQKAVVTAKAPVSKIPPKEFQDLLFTTKFNTPLNSQIVCDSIKKIVDEINLTRDVLDEIEEFSPHTLRHTFATRCFESGIQPKTVQAYLGHATLKMTMDLYTAVMPDHLTNEMDKVADTLDKISVNGDCLVENAYNNLTSNLNVIPINGDIMVV